jgi:hypothetical protein
MYMVFDPSTCFTFRSSLRVTFGRGFDRSSSHFVATLHMTIDLLWARAPAR